MRTDDKKYFMPYQIKWIEDPSPLRIIQKSRQVGITYADAYDSVIKASTKGARLDVWVSSRDQAQAKLDGMRARPEDVATAQAVWIPRMRSSLYS